MRTRARPWPDDDRLDAVLHALAHRTRRQLLNHLAAGPAMIGDLAAPIAMTRVAVSKHLRVLEKARLVSRTIDGRIHRCALRPQALREVEQWLSAYRAFWTKRLEALARLVEDPDE
ncbi:MAG TPA: metalloregulator ArsR/SmtB family transcription factor [Steroidobacteraceae bacterium]|jgi:DNA-binding transcriptional ArsR family regulator